MSTLLATTSVCLVVSCCCGVSVTWAFWSTAGGQVGPPCYACTTPRHIAVVPSAARLRPGRPSDRQRGDPTGEQVQVGVEDRLAGLGAGVEEQVVGLVALALGDDGRRGDELADDGRVGGRRRGRVGLVVARRDQDVQRRLGRDVAERDQTVVLVDDVTGDLPGDDLAKQAVR